MEVRDFIIKSSQQTAEKQKVALTESRALSPEYGNYQETTVSAFKETSKGLLLKSSIPERAESKYSYHFHTRI